MHPDFARTANALHPLFEKLMAMNPVGYNRLPQFIPKQGIYLFSEGEDHLYVGRSKNLRQRFGNHWRNGSQHNQAVFAFKIARRETGNLKPTYTVGTGSRKGLVADPFFNEAFNKAKTRLRAMDLRYVEVVDQRQQTLLELYCAIVLNCPYNDFETH